MRGWYCVQSHRREKWGRGIHDFVNDGTSPLAVPEPVVAVLQGRFGEGVVRAASPLVPGARVVGAPETDLEGLLRESPTPQFRPQVLTQMLHRELIVEMDALILERIM